MRPIRSKSSRIKRTRTSRVSKDNKARMARAVKANRAKVDQFLVDERDRLKREELVAANA